MPIINILHISDLHFQNGNEEQCDFISNFLNDIASNSLKSLCKFVVFSGDLVQSPNRENYDGVKSYFIKPLMEILQLPLDHFFLVPGNHDVSKNEIEISSEMSEQFIPIISNLFSKNTINLNEKTNRIKTHMQHKFSDFFSFRNELYGNSSSNLEHYINDFSSAHVFTYANTKIGVACINSSLTCLGNSIEENGKIYIGKEPIEVLFKKIKNCHIRIAIFHHPLDGTDIYSRDEVRSYLYENFHVILTGHTHTERSYAIVQNNDGVYYNISSCLFSDDYNKETAFDPTYSFIKIDCEDLNGFAFFRKYYAKRKEFDVDLRMFNHGRNSFSLHKKKKNLPIYSDQPFISLQKPTLTQVTRKAFQNFEEENAGFNVQFRDETFIDQNQIGVDFSMYSFRGTQFKGCTFNSCLFTNTILIDASFQDCHFSDVKFISIDHFYAVEYCGINDMVAVAGEGGVVVILKMESTLANPEKINFITKGFYYGVEGKIRSLSWRNDGNYIAAADQMGYMYIWEIEKSDPIYKEQIGITPIYAVRWSPTGNHLTSTDESGYKICIYTFEISDGEALVKNILTLYNPEHNDRHQQQILDCAWSNDAKWIATVGIDRNICIWDMSELESFPQDYYPHIKCSKRCIHGDYIRKVIWNDNSSSLITCGDDGVVKKWIFNSDFNLLESQQEICVKPGEGNNEVLSIVWYSDEFVIVGLRDDDYAIIQNIESKPKIVNTLKAHKGRIWDMSVDKDHDRIFTIGNGTIKAWTFNQRSMQLDLLCSYESKLLCTGMNFIECYGLDSGTYLVAKNKDIPERVDKGTLKDFLLSKGATIYPLHNRKE